MRDPVIGEEQLMLQRVSDPPARRMSRRTVIGFSVAICIIIAAAIYLAIPPVVTVSGRVLIVGSEKRPELIAFTAGSGRTYVAEVSLGSYSIDLPNFSTYNVTLHYIVGPFTSGKVDAGAFPVSSLRDHATQNFSG